MPLDVHRQPHLRVPRGDTLIGIEAAAHFQHLRGSLGVPTVLVLTRPLHPHGPAHGLRQQERVGRRVVTTVRAVGA